MLTNLFLDHKYNEVFRVPNRVKAHSGMDYEISDRIASGGNAVVHRAIEKISGEEYAIKIQLSLSPKRLLRFQREVELLQQVRHEQLISYVDHGESIANFTRRLPKGKRSEPEEKTLAFLVMPLAESNLTEVLGRNTGKLPYEDYIGQFKGLARALSTLHEKAVHRDIKPENILVKGETWMLSDFGLCKFH